MSLKFESRIARNRFNKTKFPIIVKTRKYTTAHSLVTVMELYKTSFQFSPVRHWNTVSMATAKLSKLILGVFSRTGGTSHQTAV